MARISNTRLNKIGESGYSCLIPHLRRNAFSFSLFNKLAVGLSYMAFIMLRYAPEKVEKPVLWSVIIINGCYILSRDFSKDTEMII